MSRGRKVKRKNIKENRLERARLSIAEQRERAEQAELKQKDRMMKRVQWSTRPAEPCALVIPDNVDGSPVVAVANSAFLDKKNISAPEDFIYVTLTDEDVINDAMGIFQQVYPNTIRIDYDNSHTRELEHVDITQLGENKRFDELISDFYRMVYKCEITEEEMAIMMDVAREAGVIDEA